MRSDWKEPGEKVWIVGHRGAPRRARENTVESLDWAESLGADAVEFDLRQTRDGEAVLFHDEEIAMGSQRVPVRSFTAREVERLVLSSEFGEYRIPKLEQVFHRYGPALRYVIEVKVAPGTQLALMARRVARLAEVYGVSRRCLVASFDAEFLRRMREAAPEIATSFLFDHPVALPEPGRPTPLFPPADAIGPRKDLVTPQLLSHAAAAGLCVHTWTVDETDEIRRLLEAGISSLSTNAPEVAIRIRDGKETAEKGVTLIEAAEPPG
ncbi:MAG: glycerophosphodiester phosphodiesterase [Rubrobacteraceae bacterium]